MSEAGGSVAAELAQLAGRPVEHPVVAARVGPPDALGVGENRAAAIDRARTHNRRSASGDDSLGGIKLGRGNEHSLLAGRRIVADQVAAAGISLDGSSVT